MMENEIVGILNLNDNLKCFFSVSELDFEINITEFLSLTISNALLFEKLSITDRLTGIKIDNILKIYLSLDSLESLRDKSPLSTIILDVDHFKNVNNTYDYQKGNQVLTETRKFLNVICRSHDTIARYGGGGFVVVLSETNSERAFPIAESIRKQVEELTFDKEGQSWNVTISCGISEINFKKMKNKDDLLKGADQALYKTKENGRNQTIIE